MVLDWLFIYFSVNHLSVSREVSRRGCNRQARPYRLWNERAESATPSYAAEVRNW
jgi:hypothetical protein